MAKYQLSLIDFDNYVQWLVAKPNIMRTLDFGVAKIYSVIIRANKMQGVIGVIIAKHHIGT